MLSNGLVGMDRNDGCIRLRVVDNALDRGFGGVADLGARMFWRTPGDQMVIRRWKSDLVAPFSEVRTLDGRKKLRQEAEFTTTAFDAFTNSLRVGPQTTLGPEGT